MPTWKSSQRFCESREPNHIYLPFSLQVQTKAVAATQLAQVTQRNITIYATEINDIYQCFQDKQKRANDIRVQAEEAQRIAQEAGTVNSFKKTFHSSFS